MLAALKGKEAGEGTLEAALNSFQNGVSGFQSLISELYAAVERERGEVKKVSMSYDFMKHVSWFAELACQEVYTHVG